MGKVNENLVSKKFARLDQEIKAANENGEVVIEGWANKAVVDDVGDLMSFDNVDMGRFSKNPIMFYNHNRDLPIGKWLSWEVLPEGLKIKGVLSKSKDRLISYVRDLISEGIIKTLSIGFDPQEEQYDKEGQYNNISKWRLNEVSVVTLPANIEAEFSLAKCLEGAKDYAEAKAKVLEALEGTKKVPAGGDTAEGKPPETMERPADGGNSAPNTDETPNKPAENAPNNQDEPPANKAEESKPCDEQKNAFQDCVSEKIPKLIAEGSSQDEAVARAMSMCSSEGKCAVGEISKADYDFAKAVAEKACSNENKPSDEPEKTKEVPATTVSQPSDDPSNFGSPFMEAAKMQVALLGTIVVNLEALNKNIMAVLDRLENSNGTGHNGDSVITEPNSDESQKQIGEIQRIKGRIEGILKDFNF